MDIRVSGMTCEHCERAVRDELGRIAGVRDVAIQIVPGGVSTITVTPDLPLNALSEAIAEAGYDIVD